MLVVDVISVDAYHILVSQTWGYRNRCFLVAPCCLIVWRQNLEVATKRLCHLRLKMLEKFYCNVTHGKMYLQLFPVFWIFLRSLGVICYMWVLSKGYKNYYQDWCPIKSVYLSVFDLFLTQWIMAILSKGCHPNNFKSPICPKLWITHLSKS